MGLLTKEVEVTLSGYLAKYYENLGYEIPRIEEIRRDKNGRNKGKRISVKRGTKIMVCIEDLPINSHYDVLVECDCCKKEYYIQYGNYTRSNMDGNIYCKSCTSALFNSRENNPNWNPNKTDEERELGRHYKEYSNFTKRILARDNFTCRCCEKSGVHLNVHHLNGYSWYIEGRTDDNNGVTLCDNCHDNFHSLYGRGNNTKEQFEEWLGETIKILQKEDLVLPTVRKVYCIEDDKIYDGVSDVIKILGGLKAGVYKSCNTYSNLIFNKTCKYNAGSFKGKHYIWYDDYLNSTQEDILKYLEWANAFSKKLINKNTEK